MLDGISPSVRIWLFFFQMLADLAFRGKNAAFRSFPFETFTRAQCETVIVAVVLQSATSPGRQLIPMQVQGPKQQRLDKVTEVYRGIVEMGPRKLNEEQRMAVASILAGRNTALARTPFALFGPPGTGMHESCAAARPLLRT